MSLGCVVLFEAECGARAQATVDVISSSGWLNPALTAMEMSQMAAQAMWDRDSHLLQLPHVGKDLAAKAAAAGVETVFDLQEMEARCLHSLQSLLPASHHEPVATATYRGHCTLV